MFVRFNVDRCIEAAGVLFSTTETKMLGRMRLLKLLYLANRVSLDEIGDPVVDDDAVAMKAGPVLSHTYDLIKGTSRDEEAQATWNAHFRIVDSIQLRMMCDPGTDHLSDHDIKSLNRIAQKYANWDDDDLSELTHTFDEYKDNWDGSRLSAPISKIDLLKGIGYTPEQIKVSLAESRLFAMEQVSLGCQ